MENRMKRMSWLLDLLLVIGMVVANVPQMPAHAATTSVAAITCEGRCYVRYDVSMTWKEAKAYCESLGGHLVTITSAEEQAAVCGLLGGNPKNCYWIGLTRDTVNAKWEWVTGETFAYTNWTKGEPNNDQSAGENYGHLFGVEYTNNSGRKKYVGQWNDATNKGAAYAAAFYALPQFGFICEYEYRFPDVPPTLWSYNAVEFAVEKGYFSGYKSGNFGPTDNITRQDFVVVLARIAGADLNKYSGRTDFPDVVAGSYYEKAVKWASSTGVVSGYNSGKFGVGDKITREQLVTILYRYAQMKGYDTSVPGNAAAKLSVYKDADEISSYAKTAVIWALNKGVISGMTASTVGPKNNASRGQVATILMNISKKSIMPF